MRGRRIAPRAACLRSSMMLSVQSLQTLRGAKAVNFCRYSRVVELYR